MRSVRGGYQALCLQRLAQHTLNGAPARPLTSHPAPLNPELEKSVTLRAVGMI